MKILFQRLEEARAEGDLAVKQFLSGERKRMRVLGDAAAADRIFVCNELGGIYREQSLFAQAIDCLKEALELVEGLPGGKNTLQYATVLLNLAGVYRLKGDYNKALDMYAESRKIMEDLGQTDVYEYASALNNLSLAQQKAGEYEEAYKNALEARDIIERIYPGEVQVGIANANLASIALKLDKLEAAEELAQKALEIYQANDTTRGHYPAVLNQLATIRFLKKDYDEAVDLYQQAASLTERNFGKNVDYAQALNNLSEVYKAMGKDEEAQAALKEAEEVVAQCK